MPKWEVIITKVVEMAILYLPKLLLGIVTLLVGFWIAKVLTRILHRWLERAKVELTLREFLTNIVSILLKILVVISVATMVGIQMTSFIAIISAMAFAVGLAFQGSLSNFAGGVLIVLLKPFKIGDFIEAQGFSGTVETIQIFHTILRTPANQIAVIPNGPLSNANILNYSSKETRRNEWTFNIDYSEDYDKARQLILDILEADERILKDPALFVRIGALSSSSVDIKVRAWIPLSDFWNVNWDVLEAVKKSFDANDIHIPFPQTDVHLYQRKTLNN